MDIMEFEGQFFKIQAIERTIILFMKHEGKWKKELGFDRIFIKDLVDVLATARWELELQESNEGEDDDG